MFADAAPAVPSPCPAGWVLIISQLLYIPSKCFPVEFSRKNNSSDFPEINTDEMLIIPIVSIEKKVFQEKRGMRKYKKRVVIIRIISAINAPREYVQNKRGRSKKKRRERKIFFTVVYFLSDEKNIK